MKKVPTGIAVRAPESKREMRQAHEMLAAVSNGEENPGAYWRSGYSAGYPGSPPEHTRIAMWGGELAGVLRITSETLRLGEARLKAGGLGAGPAVARRRDKGVARLLLEDAMAYLHSHQYHAALLFGDWDVHYPLGFAPALPEYCAVTGVLLPQGAAPEHTARPAKPGDLKAIQRIHNANDANAACSVLRSTAHFTNKWTQSPGFHVLTDAQGKIAAYFIEGPATPRALEILETGVTGTASCNSLLRACSERAALHNRGSLRFHMPPTHPFARYLHCVPSVHETHIAGDGGGMMALVDAAEALENLIPEWENALAQSSLAEKSLELTLLAGNTPFRVRARRGAIDIAAQAGQNRVRLGRRALVQLIAGYLPPDHLLGEGQNLLAPEALQLFRTLFPARAPYVWQFDRA